MKCIYCNTKLAKIDFCPGCGADVTLLKRIGRISNLLYNRGLEKAQVRDLSGAIDCLKQSLKFNKENTQARNLLGLCYYETGEVVSALCEWVISKNMGGKDNPADYYITALQNNKNQLDTINQSIRKYNQSIDYCHQDHEDMAIMQLRKVVSSNPKLVKAQQLLALLYMKHQEYEKARRVLRKAASIDNTNTTTLRYLTEIEEMTGKSGGFSSRRRRERSDQGNAATGTLRYLSGSETIIQPTTFRDSSSVATFINIGLGILLGGAIVWFMAVPASRQAISEAANSKVTDANLQLASGNAQLQDLQNKISDYESQIEKAEDDRKDALAKVESYEELLGIASQYVNGESTAAADAMERIDDATLEGNAKTLYDNLMSGVSGTLFNGYYTAGTTAYVAHDYKTAAEQLKLAVETDKDGTNSNYFNALYYLGFAYFNLGDNANANKYFNEIVEKFPDQAYQVQGYITNNTDNSAAASQGEASIQSDGTGTDTGNANTWNGDSWTDNSAGQETGQEVTIYDENTGSGGATYDPSQVAWTDPYTGLHYDAYGNLLG